MPRGSLDLAILLSRYPFATADKTNKSNKSQHSTSEERSTSLRQNEQRFHDSLPGQPERAKSLCASPSTDGTSMPGSTPLSVHQRVEERQRLARSARRTSQTPSSILKCCTRGICDSRRGDGVAARALFPISIYLAGGRGGGHSPVAARTLPWRTRSNLPC